VPPRIRLESALPVMRVLALGSYYNDEARALDRAMNPGSFDALNFARFVFAVKDGGSLKFKGYTSRTVAGRTFKIGDRLTKAQNLENALELGLALAREAYPDGKAIAKALGLSHMPIAVPVPSRDATVSSENPKRWGPRDLAGGIAKKQLVHDLVRFKDPPPAPASKGGPRDAHTLRDHMVLLKAPPKGSKSAVIVDDVLTSGGHMQAVAMLLLEETEIEEVAGLCLAATVSQPVADPWEPRIVQLNAFGREGE
jgi:hypothetical protein